VSQVARILAAELERASILAPPGRKSALASLASGTTETESAFLEALSDNALGALAWLFEFWALEHQQPPEGDWRTWVVMGGRGAGKTRAGAEWVRAQVEGAGPGDAGVARRVALIGETYDQAVAVMIKGDSGLLACSPPDRRPRWIMSERRLVWPNGAEARAYSASDPEALRGPQFDCAWADELAKWPRARDAWDMLQFGLRLGTSPRAVVTTTPRNVAVLRELLERESTVSTHAPTEANRAFLADGFIEEIRARYGSTRLGRQEIDGELLAEADDALWRRADIDAGRVDAVPEGARTIVAVDPPVTGHDGSDACGIVVVSVVTKGAPGDWRAVVIADCSIGSASPGTWAKAAARAYHHYGADRMVAEVNQGGELVEVVMRQIDPLVNYVPVRATRGKSARAEPVAALYEQGRVAHLGTFPELEDEMCLMTRQGFDGQGSPDRVDALVWAVTDGLLRPAAARLHPGIRAL
jgi:phage terminase large subunit-like protein